jgi:TP901 family phage tail tape measure protein
MATRVAELEVLITANASQAKSELNEVSRSFHNIIAGGALLGAGRGIVGWFKDAITSGAAFEQTMIRVDQLATGAAVGVDALTKKAFQVDQMTIYSAQQIAEAMEQLAREGFTGEQILGDWTDAAVNFAAVINEDVVSSANIMGQVARVFKEEGLEAAEVADILSQAILRSGRSAAEFMTGFQYVGAIASELGIPLEEMATSLSYLQSIGIKGRSAGTGLRSMFLELAAGSDAFGMSHGVQAFDPVTGDFVGMPKIIDQFGQLLDGMSKAEGLQFIGDIFGKPAASPLYALFTGGIEAYEAHNEKMRDLGSAATFMEKLMDTIAGSLDRFQAASSNFARAMGVIAGNILKPFIDIMTILLGVMTDAPRIVQIAAIAITGLAGAMMILSGAIMVFKGLGGMAILFSAFKIMGVVALASSFGLLALIGAVILFRDKLGGWGESIKEAFGPFMNILEYLSSINQANNPVQKFLGAMDDGPLKTFAIGAGRVVEALADLWYFISQGDWDRFWRRLPGELRQAAGGFDIMFDAIGDVDWSEKILSAIQWTGENIVFPMIVATFEVGMALAGDLAKWAGNLWGWVQSKIFGEDDGVGGAALDALTGRRGRGSSDTEYKLPFGTVSIEAGIQLTGTILAAAGNLWGWVKANLQTGGTTSYSPTGIYADGGTGEQIMSGSKDNTLFIGTVFIDGVVSAAESLLTGLESFVPGLITKVTSFFTLDSETGEASITLGSIKINLIPELAEGVDDDLFETLSSVFQVTPEMAIEIENFGEELGTLLGTVLGSVLGADFLNENNVELTGPSDEEWANAFSAFADGFARGFRMAIKNTLEEDLLTFLNEDLLGFWNEILGLFQKIPIVGGAFEDRELMAWMDENGNVMIGFMEDYELFLQEQADGNPPEVMLPPPLFLMPGDMGNLDDRSSNAWNTMFNQGKYGGPSDDSDYVFHSPGEGYAIPQAPSYTPPPITAEEQVIPARLELDTTDALAKLASLIGGGGTSKAKYVGGGNTFKATFELDTAEAAAKKTEAQTWGLTWAGAVYESDFNINSIDATNKANTAFMSGFNWAGSLFTATFSVNISPLETALVRVREIAQEISDVMPHSPARKGPLREEISFQYIADNFGSVADQLALHAQASAATVAGSFDRAYNAQPTMGVRAPASAVHNTFNYAVTAEDLARLQKKSEQGLMTVAETDKEIRMTLGMV